MKPAFTWRLKTQTLTLGRRTLVMGVVNVTPDSFSDGGRYFSPDAAVAQALRLAEEGADLLDLGGESTRPGSGGVAAAEEAERVIPVLEALARRVDLPLSIDTQKAEVARLALAAGAEIINDISGGAADPEMLPLAARSGCGLILMHLRGTPSTMQSLAEYADLLGEVKAELTVSTQAALAAGVRPEAIVLDPGLGFAKKPTHNLDLVRRLGELAGLGFPLLLGPSRKSFIGWALQEQGLPDGPADRLEGTLAAVSLGALAGAHLVRVHDVAPARRALAVADAVRDGDFVSR